MDRASFCRTVVDVGATALLALQMQTKMLESAPAALQLHHEECLLRLEDPGFAPP